MGKLSIILLLSSFFMIISFTPLAHSKTKVTKIRLYLQDTFVSSQPPAYGDVFAFQDPLTVGPDPNSTLLGRAQGTIAFTARDDSFDLHVSLAYIFTCGSKYNGSTVVAVGRNDVTQSVRQFPIVGGTGAFKLAHGIVTGSTYSTDPSIFIYDLEIFQDYHHSSEIEMK